MQGGMRERDRKLGYSKHTVTTLNAFVRSPAAPGRYLDYLCHSFASRALALGESLPTIARLLGHARVQTTSRYAHLARDTVREAAARVAADIGGDILPGPPGGNSAPSRPVPDPAADGRARGALRASAERIAACIGADIRG